MAGDGRELGRRSFLARAGAAGSALGVLGGIRSLLRYQTQAYLLREAPVQADEPRAQWEGASVKSYRPLGRTGWQMSDISFGSGGLRDPDVLRLALDRGINYVDTSPDYSDSMSEQAVGEAVQGRRDKVFIASKFCTPDGHLDADTPVAKIIEAVEESLGRLRTDYVDLLHVHACNSVDRLMAPTFHEAFDRLKEQGKARFMGVSSHTPKLEEVMARAVESDRFDVIMPAYNFRHWPALRATIDRAHEKQVGVVAMKTLKGAYHTVLGEFKGDERASFTQAAFKWINNNPAVSGLVVTIKNAAQVDEYLYASGTRMDPADLLVLKKYEDAVSDKYCPPGCGDCLESCPSDLPVNDVLRYSTYYRNYGNEREAVDLYSRLTEGRAFAETGGTRSMASASDCLGCSAPCEAACPEGLPIRKLMGQAHRTLS